MVCSHTSQHWFDITNICNTATRYWLVSLFIVQCNCLGLHLINLYTAAFSRRSKHGKLIESVNASVSLQTAVYRFSIHTEIDDLAIRPFVEFMVGYTSLKRTFTTSSCIVEESELAVIHPARSSKMYAVQNEQQNFAPSLELVFDTIAQLVLTSSSYRPSQALTWTSHQVTIR